MNGPIPSACPAKRQEMETYKPPWGFLPEEMREFMMDVWNDAIAQKKTPTQASRLAWSKAKKTGWRERKSGKWHIPIFKARKDIK